MNFNQINLIPTILQAVADAGYTTATDIQYKAIPSILEGKDIIGCAQTGTGKTAAFAIPILQTLSQRNTRKGIRCLVVTPTRELAIQIEENFKIYGKYLPLKCVSIIGGVPMGKQIRDVRQQVDILIATPGRLLDLMREGHVNLGQIEILVLDEADRMLDMGFINDIKKILSKLPTDRQSLFFSATMPASIKKFAYSILRSPIEVTVTPVSSTARTVQQSVYHVEKKEKSALLVHLLQDKTIQRSLVFTRTKRGADRLVKHLGKSGIKSAAIHGDKSQNARQNALSAFKSSGIRVLVATDIAARGIDIDDLPHVVNFELPDVPETYVHRIGRTGRAGLEGVAVSFCDVEERSELHDIQKLIGFKMPVAGELALRRTL